MLPTQLQKIKNHLLSKPTLTKVQKQLLNELNFIDGNQKISDEFKGYSYEATLLESFSMAVGSCPNCGKAY